VDHGFSLSAGYRLLMLSLDGGRRARASEDGPQSEAIEFANILLTPKFRGLEGGLRLFNGSPK